jgi:catechol 2,3-dioxygenase-like lactoylglutathione lyase family enzyme
MTLPAESQVGRRAARPARRKPSRRMAAHDRIRLTGRLRRGPARAGPLYFPVACGAGPERRPEDRPPGSRPAVACPTVLDHIGINVSDYDRSRAFYEKALAPLGYTLLMEPMQGIGGFGRAGKPDFWIAAVREPTTHNVHVALVAPDRETVDAFHAAALDAGGTDNGGPGLREHYHPSYYGAFVLDPDGNNIEAVCHRPPG